MTVTKVMKKLRETGEVQQSGCSIAGDIIQIHIMTLLDARSLARTAAVCTQWRAMALADWLWQPLCDEFWTKRAHIPLCLVLKSCKLSPYLAYAISVADSKQQELCHAEMCRHTWEILLKPPCGSYWLNLDPSQRGRAALRRYFHCDGSISSTPNDPIWGGQESVWRFLHVVGPDGHICQHVQINHWPLFNVKRLKDGRWRLENYYAYYLSKPDNPTYAYAPSCSQEKKVHCNMCTPPTYGLI
ncbi:unnamed protein product [Sphagnum jensenii]|uniref:F-box domain-containing protein n=1 Tax=Sphagnum jensenii TaxID=128206 RepID=A0ABP0VZ71_9BRYO